MSLIEQGLTVGMIGMGTTFAVLGLVVVIMILLRSLSGSRQATLPNRATGTATEMAVLPGVVEEEAVAAIAVALAHLGVVETTQGGLGSCLETGPGPWWQGSQRAQQRLPGRGTH